MRDLKRCRKTESDNLEMGFSFIESLKKASDALQKSVQLCKDAGGFEMSWDMEFELDKYLNNIEKSLEDLKDLGITWD